MPSVPCLYTSRGIVYSYQKRLDRAIEDLNHAIELDENYTMAYLHRGQSYCDLKDYERGIKDFN
jgi:tetratricopeptide (TPR) repeat protein